MICWGAGDNMTGVFLNTCANNNKVGSIPYLLLLKYGISEHFVDLVTCSGGG